MNYIVLDLEFNQAFPFKSGKKVEPNPECPFEIIQIGAVNRANFFCSFSIIVYASCATFH